MSNTGVNVTKKKPEPADPLGKRPEPPDRTAYATGMFLGAEDFESEQLYHRGRLARALRYLHGAGTIAGLRVVWRREIAPGADPNFPAGREEELVVEPGVALDRLGRVIEIPAPACIRLNRWYEGQAADRLTRALHPKGEGVPLAGVVVPAPERKEAEREGEGVDEHSLVSAIVKPLTPGVVVDLFVRYFLCERGKTPAFASGPFDAIDAVRPARLREFYKLELVPRHEDDPREVLPRDLWPNLSGVADANERWRRIQDAALGAWHEGRESDGGGWNDDGPVPLREHVVGQDTTSLFLARVTLPADRAPANDRRPVRRRGADVEVDNHSRAFVYTAGALARWLGLSVPGHD